MSGLRWLQSPLAGTACVLAGLGRTQAWAAEATSFVEGKPFACTDYSAKKVFLVGPDGKVTWEYASGTCNELWVLPNGNLLFNTGFGVREVTREKQVVFDYTTKSEVYACQRLANGNTLVNYGTDGTIREVTPDGEIAWEVDFRSHLVGHDTLVPDLYALNRGP